jgi:hypothetical protein
MKIEDIELMEPKILQPQVDTKKRIRDIVLRAKSQDEVYRLAFADRGAQEREPCQAPDARFARGYDRAFIECTRGPRNAPAAGSLGNIRRITPSR